MDIPGEDLPHVSHYYTEAHAYFRKNVVVVGGANSTADAALEMYRAGVKVTIVHRGEDWHKGLKSWVQLRIWRTASRTEPSPRASRPASPASRTGPSRSCAATAPRSRCRPRPCSS